MQVLLVHGLGRHRLSMWPLARCLRAAGHEPELFGYSAAREGVNEIKQRLATRLRVNAAKDQPIALIGHSFGGLLLRMAAADVSPDAIKHLIMLGTPNRPPRLGGLIDTGQCVYCEGTAGSRSATQTGTRSCRPQPLLTLSSRERLAGAARGAPLVTS